MRSLLTAFIVIIFLQTYVCPQDVKSEAKLHRIEPFSLVQEEQLLLRTKSADKSELYKGLNNFIIKKLGKIKTGTESDGNIYVPKLIIFDSTQKSTFTWNEDRSKESEVSQVLTDGQWSNVDRRTYLYDNGRPAGFLYEQWQNGAWVNVERMTETYQDNYTKYVSVSEKWVSGVWVPYSRNTFIYDANGNFLSYTWEQMANGIWTNVLRSDCTYDGRGNLLTYTNQEWANGAWENREKYTHSYNDQGKELTYLFQYWQNGLWTNLMRGTSTYDSNGNELSFLQEEWRNGDLVKEYRITRAFDNKNRQLTELYEDWINGAWVNNSRSNNTYSINSDKVTSLLQIWRQDAWIDSSRITRTFNTNGHLLTFLSENSVGSSWVNYKMQRLHYDYFGNADKGESFVWKDGAWTPFSSILEFNYNNGKDHSEYYGASVQIAYGLFLDEGPSVAQEFNVLQNYPNPFNSSTSIAFTIRKTAPVRISVYDILGNRVAVVIDEIKNPGFFRVEFNGSRLPSGVYIYRLESGGFNIAKKFILMK